MSAHNPAKAGFCAAALELEPLLYYHEHMTIEEHVSLRELTTLKIGGTARYFVSAATIHDLVEAVVFAREKEVPFVVLGGGSNVLISGGEFKGLVIKNDIRGIEWKDEAGEVLAVAGAGESWDGLVAQAVQKGLWGIENLSAIPGTVGAAPIQNIGAYGTEVKATVDWVEVFDASTGTTKQFSNSQCRFGYRDSIFKHQEGKTFIVCRVALRLRTTGTPNLGYTDLQKHFAGKNAPSLQEVREAVIDIRSKKFPDLREFGTAGSFFKNPVITTERFDELKKKFPELPGFPGESGVKISLAWVLDKVCGLKGYEKGNVKLFEKQPIVLVQNGLASAEEIISFAKEIAGVVKDKTGLEIEWEVQHI